MNYNLNEDMARSGDLEDMVLPLISIDEYESKVDNDAATIVVAFYTHNEKSAKDIRAFVERGTVQLLDAEVSPNPNEQNHWPIFIEYKRNGQFWRKLTGTIGEIERLIGSKVDWNVSTYFSNEVIELEKAKLNNIVILSPADYIIKHYKKKKSEVAEAFGDFFNNSLIESYDLTNNGRIILSSGSIKASFKLYSFGKYDDIINENTIIENIDFYVPSEVRLLESLFKEYYINLTTDKIYIQNKTDDNTLVLERYG